MEFPLSKFGSRIRNVFGLRSPGRRLEASATLPLGVEVPTGQAPLLAPPITTATQSPSRFNQRVHASASEAMEARAIYRAKVQAEQMTKAEFGFDSKLLEAIGTSAKRQVQIDFAKFREARAIGGTVPLSAPIATLEQAAKKLEAMERTVRELKDTAPVPVAKAAPEPATDKNGTPVSTPPPKGDAVDLAGMLPELITELQKIIDDLKQRMGESSDADESEAKAFLVKGDTRAAFAPLARRAHRLTAKARALNLTGDRVIAKAFAAQLKASAPKPIPLPVSRLPEITAATMPSALLNQRFMEELEALDAQVNACAARGEISQELLARRRKVNQEWLTVNRRR